MKTQAFYTKSFYTELTQVDTSYTNKVLLKVMIQPEENLKYCLESLGFKNFHKKHTHPLIAKQKST